MDEATVSTLFTGVGSDLTDGIWAIAPIALGVFGVIFVIKRGKSLFSGLAKG